MAETMFCHFSIGDSERVAARHEDGRRGGDRQYGDDAVTMIVSRASRYGDSASTALAGVAGANAHAAHYLVNVKTRLRPRGDGGDTFSGDQPRLCMSNGDISGLYRLSSFIVRM